MRSLFATSAATTALINTAAVGVAVGVCVFALCREELPPSLIAGLIAMLVAGPWFANFFSRADGVASPEPSVSSTTMTQVRSQTSDFR